MTLRIGLVGCGGWGRYILRDLLACGAEVHVVARSEATLTAALTGGARSAGTDLDSLATCDGVIVATSSVTHADVIERLVPLGMPIFVEKPMATDLAQARRLAAAAAGRLFVMDKWRYHPGIEAMRVEIEEGRAGEVLAIRLIRWSWGNPHKDAGPHWHLAPHDLSIVLHLIGAVPPLRSATASRQGDTLLGFTAQLGGLRGPAITLDIGIASPSHRRHCLVIGSQATLELRGGYEQQVFVRDGAPGSPAAVERVIEVGGAMPLLLEIERFLGFLRGGPAPMSSAAEGLKIVERIAEIETALGQRRGPS